MNDLVSLTAVYVATLIVVAMVGLYHERSARRRAKDYKLQHDEEMIELRASLGLIRSAIYQRTTLEAEVAWVLKAIENHATHLEDMGRDKPMKYAPIHK